MQSLNSISRIIYCWTRQRPRHWSQAQGSKSSVSTTQRKSHGRFNLQVPKYHTRNQLTYWVSPLITIWRLITTLQTLCGLVTLQLPQTQLTPYSSVDRQRHGQHFGMLNVGCQQDYCRALWYGMMQKNCERLQWRQCALARVVCNAPYHFNLCHNRNQLHQLPVEERVSTKWLLWCTKFDCISNHHTSWIHQPPPTCSFLAIIKLFTLNCYTGN
jgi:hypothetical protein